jgi:divalent metal cation (Fe/Co/Zn/Cd) transporter
MDEDGKRVVLYSIFLNIVLVFAKGGIALLSGSTAVLAETIHSFTDVIGSLAICWGNKSGGMGEGKHVVKDTVKP